MFTFSNTPSSDEKKIKTQCCICGSSQTTEYEHHGLYSFQKCNCGHVYQNPMPDPMCLAKRYDANYMKYELENRNNFLQLMMMGLQDVQFDAISLGLPTSKRFLDIGCATGALVGEMSRQGWFAHGIDICDESIACGISLGENISVGTVESLPQKGIYHFIHSSHVIEHVPFPRVMVESIYNLLAPGGYCFTVTPNINSLGRLIYQKKWRSAIADHVNLFSLSKLIQLHQSVGLQVKQLTTWGCLPKGSINPMLKKAIDRLIKHTHFGDVCGVLCHKPDLLLERKNNAQAASPDQGQPEPQGLTLPPFDELIERLR